MVNFTWPIGKFSHDIPIYLGSAFVLTDFPKGSPLQSMDSSMRRHTFSTRCRHRRCVSLVSSVLSAVCLTWQTNQYHSGPQV